MDFKTSLPSPNIISGFSSTGSDDSWDEFYDASDGYSNDFHVFGNLTDVQPEVSHMKHLTGTSHVLPYRKVS
jgi:hypothetical protein